MSGAHDYKARAEECCHHATDACSVAEKEVWLTLAENWLILARSTSDAALQSIAQRIVECAHETQRGRSPEGIELRNGLSNKKLDHGSMVARALALRSAEQLGSRRAG
jgi:hypothetical protein